MRWVWSPLVVAALLSAGCAGDDGTRADDDEAKFEDIDVQASSGKGVIRGVVVDETVTPIEGATVQVQGQELEATTNENGAFAFSDLEPGTYFLTASKDGYDEVQVNAEVAAGVDKPPILKVQLPRLPGSEPYYTPYSWDGFIGCSYRQPDLLVQGGRGSSCPFADTLWPRHEFIVDYELDRLPDWTVSEMSWKNTQTLGGEMSFNLRRDDTNRDTTDVEGTSPLFLTMNKTLAGEDGIGDDSPLRVIVFTAHLQETEPPWGGWGLGFQYEQEFSTYTHVFYNYVPDPEWRFMHDATVPKPPQ